MYTLGLMITEEQKYKAFTFNVAGFALMTPLGKIILDFSDLIKNYGLGWFFAHLVISALLFIWGLTWVERGRIILSIKKERRYGSR